MLKMGTSVIYLTLLLAISGALSDSSSEERESIEFTDAQLTAIEDLAFKHAPFLRFHKTEGTQEFCFPHDATEYYETRKAQESMGQEWDHQCNMNYTSIQDGDIPTYWHAKVCEDHLYIAYWSFTGYNHKCDGVSGERHAWWEQMVVKVRNWEVGPIMAEVMYGQKQGWYTRIPGHYEIMEGSHPVAYVGRASHGFYHDDGGTNTCCYFEDSRNPGLPDQFMRTQNFLEELVKDGSGEDWMTDPSTHYWSGILSPTYRDNWDLCRLKGCDGSFLLLCTKCGCHKSDIGDDPF